MAFITNSNNQGIISAFTAVSGTPEGITWIGVSPPTSLKNFAIRFSRIGTFNGHLQFVLEYNNAGTLVTGVDFDFPTNIELAAGKPNCTLNGVPTAFETGEVVSAIKPACFLSDITDPQPGWAYIVWDGSKFVFKVRTDAALAVKKVMFDSFYELNVNKFTPS